MIYYTVNITVSSVPYTSHFTVETAQRRLHLFLGVLLVHLIVHRRHHVLESLPGGSVSQEHQDHPSPGELDGPGHVSVGVADPLELVLPSRSGDGRRVLEETVDLRLLLVAQPLLLGGRGLVYFHTPSVA